MSRSERFAAWFRTGLVLFMALCALAALALMAAEVIR